MTKKDYELFAYHLNKEKQAGFPIDSFVRIACDVFKADNPLFQADKFERACYEGKHIRKSIKGEL